jgi:uncharacterized membrane protein YhiD involved in acid resistance
VVAYRPWRRLLSGVPPVTRETAQAQTLIAVAGAIMVAIIGDSTALAFGLVGLGGFIRFRSGIKDTRDAAVMFVMIGVGMACGLGLMGIAMAAAAFSMVVLALFDTLGTSKPTRTQVIITVDDPRASFQTIRNAFQNARVVTLPNTNPEPGRIVLEIDAAAGMDAAVVLNQLEQSGVQGVRQVSFEEAG